MLSAPFGPWGPMAFAVTSWRGCAGRGSTVAAKKPFGLFVVLGARLIVGAALAATCLHANGAWYFF